MKINKNILMLIAMLLFLSSCSNLTDKTKDILKNKEKITDDTIQETSSNSSENHKTKKDELILVAREISATLDSAKKYTEVYLRRLGVLESLFESNVEGIVVPKIAENSKEVDENTWNIKLRENSKFSSGKLIDAKSVIDSFERSRKLSGSIETILKGLEFNVIDDLNIEVKTNYKHMSVPLILTNVPVYNPNVDYTNPESTDYTGMYKIDEFIPKQKMVLSKNENYYGKKPIISKIIYEEIGDAQTRVLAAVGKRADIVTGVLPANAKEIEKNPDLVLEISNPSTSLAVYLNLQRKPYDDVRVRQALNWAVDRKELVDISSDGYGMAISTWLGSNPLFASQQNAVFSEYNLQKASDLLDEAGWKMGEDRIRSKDGKKLEFKLFTWGNEKVLGELIQNQWTKLGVKVELNHVEYSLIQKARSTGQWDGLVEAWTSYGDLQSILASQFSKEGSVNYGGYNSKEVNEMLDDLRNATNDEKRHEIAEKINLKVTQDSPLISLMPRPNLIILNKKLKGFQPHFLQQNSTITEKLYFEE